MRLGAPVPEGGLQDPQAYSDMHLRQLQTRERVRCMYPGEFVSIIESYRAGRYCASGVYSSDRTNQDRKVAGIVPCGTVWFATKNERSVLSAVPKNCMPYAWIKPPMSEWNEMLGKWRHPEKMVLGWRKAISDLVRGGYLRPDPYL